MSTDARTFVAMALTLVGFLASSAARAADGQGSAEEIEHSLIVGVGGASEIELGDGSLHTGANVMVEWDAIENWLELEVEASVLAADSGVEVPFALLVKKPFRLARKVEFMIGVGPEVVQVAGANKGTYVGGEVALDFMFWPTRPVGLWLAPIYDFIFHAGVSHGLGSTGGLLIGW
jgi:hypothetical protein